MLHSDLSLDFSLITLRGLVFLAWVSKVEILCFRDSFSMRRVSVNSRQLESLELISVSLKLGWNEDLGS